MSTALYMRVSSPKGQKTDSQRAELEAWLKRHHYTSVQWFEDHESATTMQRDAFQRLQTAIFVGTIMTVVVWKLDRLARSLKEGVNVLADWCQRGVRIIAITQQIDLSGPVGHLIASIEAIGDRGQREVTCRAVPLSLPSRPRHRVVKGRANRGALCPFARMVTGEATTAVVTPAWRVGSRLEACLWCAPRPRGLRTSCGGRTKRWHLQPVVQARANHSSGAPVGCERRRESRGTSLLLGWMWGRPSLGWPCPQIGRHSRGSGVGR